jgi:hypothetical protein
MQQAAKELAAEGYTVASDGYWFAVKNTNIAAPDGKAAQTDAAKPKA